mgnify:CR=1 FL=1
MNDSKITDLTISQFKSLIRETVQEAVAEVIIEINAIAEADDDFMVEAEMAEYLRTSLQQNIPFSRYGNPSHLDD